MNDEKFCIIDLGFTKCYLLECFEGYLLIDTSYKGKYTVFLKEMEKLEIDISKIKYIFITHHHADHAGVSAKLIKETGAKLIVNQNALVHLKEGKTGDIMKPVGTVIKLIHPFLRILHRNTKFPPVLPKKDDIIVNGDDYQVLRQIGVNGNILYTPGHSKDSISILLDNGNAFVGDLVMNNFNSGNIKFMPFLVDNKDVVLEGWDKVIDNGAKIIYPAHGDYFTTDELILSKSKIEA
jgi:glyoxylase-like metal-dependent hydrolase (beta-lactamase superfamily II)